MTLTEIYADLIRRGVRCFSGTYDMDAPTDAVAIRLAGGAWGIFLDERRIRTTAQEKVATSHEWAHIVTDATYSIEAPRELKRLAETIATRKQIEAVLPWDVLRQYLRQNIPQYEIADREGVTEDFVRLALDYYINKRGRKP